MIPEEVTAVMELKVMNILQRKSNAHLSVTVGLTYLQVGRNLVICGVYQRLIQINEEHKFFIPNQALFIRFAQFKGFLLRK